MAHWLPPLHTAMMLPRMATSPARSGDAVLETEALRLVIGGRGQIISLLDRARGVEYAAQQDAGAILQVRCDGQFAHPSEMRWDAGTMRLIYGDLGVEAHVQTTVKPGYVLLDLVALDPLAEVEAVQWGPIPTSIKGAVGEIIGVVRDDDFAIGIQGLNVKTLGGAWPNDEGVEFSRGRTAEATDYGSVLQAYTLDRSRPRNITVWGKNFPNMPVPPIEGETVLGSKIALFGCSAAEALDRIGEIEVAEGLPHPEFDGIWAKKSPESGRSYLIAPFAEDTVDEWLDYTERGHFGCLYHEGPFKSWGHFGLYEKLFPNGVEGMKRCVEKARQRGIRVGAHVLTNFIHTHDAYITPVPDPRLAKTGSSELVEDINPTDAEIPVASPEYFNNTEANWLRTVMIDQELIRYRTVSDAPPWRLLDCQRGAFGTMPAAHTQGAEVAKLMDHDYKVFLTSYEMQHEVAVRLARLFNETGMCHMDFDGHEGCWSSGQGDFATEMFAKVFYEHLERPIFNGSSMCKPFYWHINTAVNWGEPWYAGFRESMAEYRFNNQALLTRNLMPNMLGWFSMTAETTLADIEWMLARGAGYNAGFALATDIDRIRANTQTGAILDAIRVWEEARRCGAFSDEQQVVLRDPSREFHLEEDAPGQWRLYPVHVSEALEYEKKIRQPGEPTADIGECLTTGGKQPLQFQLDVEGVGGTFSKPSIEIDGYIQVEIDAEIAAGQRIVFDGTETVRIYDSDGRQINTIELPRPAPDLSPGHHQLALSGEFTGNPAAKAVLRLKSLGEPEAVHTSGKCPPALALVPVVALRRTKGVHSR